MSRSYFCLNGVRHGLKGRVDRCPARAAADPTFRPEYSAHWVTYLFFYFGLKVQKTASDLIFKFGRRRKSSSATYMRRYATKQLTRGIKSFLTLILIYTLGCTKHFYQCQLVKLYWQNIFFRLYRIKVMFTRLFIPLCSPQVKGVRLHIYWRYPC